MKQLKKYAYKYGVILLGNFFVAVGTVFFIVPAGLITGGATGIALALHEFFHFPLPLGIAAVSLTLFIIGLIFLGREFALSILVSSVFYPIFVGLCEEFVKYADITTDALVLNLAGAALFIGYGIAIVMRQGASTGGFDTVSVILNKKLGVSTALSFSIFEILSMLTQVFYSTVEQILGGVFLTLAYTALLNALLSKDIERIQVQIFSEHYEEISTLITEKFERGCTLFRIQGGYTKKASFAVQTVIGGRELFRLKEAIKKTDPKAFVTVSRISEVSGLGFTYEE